jgi:glutathione S-transferase
MKLYMHPVSMTSRPIRLFIAENGIDVEEQMVDILAGEHYQEPYASMNPNRLVPMLDDGDLRLTESSAILKYLADKIDSPAYPKDLKARAKVNEMMDWFNTNFYREYAYHMIYPQLFPNHKREPEAAQQSLVAWGKENAQNWLRILDEHWIGPDQAYLCGNEITIADYFGVCLLTLGEIVRCDFSSYPNIERWLGNMKKLKNWGPVNEVLYGYAESVKDQQFEVV